MIEEGSFRCPKCDSIRATYNSDETLSLCEKKGDKWIFKYDVDDYRYNTAKDYG